jgi:CheY-like chemotaxis protein
MLMEALQMFGHEVRIARDGVDAIRVAEQFVPDVALLDLGLPVMDGYELANHFRSHPVLSRTRLIAVTGYGQDTDRRRTRQSGFAAHMVKPVDLDQLKTIVDDVPARDHAAE